MKQSDYEGLHFSESNKLAEIKRKEYTLTASEVRRYYDDMSESEIMKKFPYIIKNQRPLFRRVDVYDVGIL